MRKCSYCGKEYPDDAVRCLIDEQPLSGGETVTRVAEEVAVPPLPTPLAPAYPKFVLTDRQMEILEVVLVCVMAFGVSILGSVYLFFGSTYGHSHDSYAWAGQGLREGSCIALVWYLLQRRGKSFRDLGLGWSLKDFGWSIVLAFASRAAFYVVFSAIHFSGLAPVDSKEVFHSVGQYLFGSGIFFTTILIQFINPFFEELIVRAYLMTEVRRLTNSVIKAVLISTVLQASYHFYQGGPAAIAHGAEFLVLSIYYAKTNRITPIILAHLYADVGGTLEYWLRYY